jgi:hypothetical protein
MKIIHLTGASMAGKTWVREQFKDVPGWDVKADFYVPNGCIVDGSMNWEQFKRVVPNLPNALANSMNKAATADAQAFFVESSGISKWVNNTLVNLGLLVTEIHLSTPTDRVVVSRAKHLGVPPPLHLNALIPQKGITPKRAVDQIRRMLRKPR